MSDYIILSLIHISSGVHHKILIAVSDGEAGIVAVNGLGISGTENIKLFHKAPP